MTAAHVTKTTQATVLTAARVVTGKVVHTPGWISYHKDRIVAVGAGRPERVDHDLGNSVVVPGFVDLHVHGGGGGAFTENDPSSAMRAIQAHRQHGTTTTIASLVTDSPDGLLSSVAMLADLYLDGHIAGIHLEGPWLSPHRCGAHEPTQLRHPDPQELRRLLNASRGAIFAVTLAPELPGANTAIRQIVDAGATAAIGHTAADYKQTTEAIAAGARTATHLFNAMQPIHHRNPGPIVALLEDPRVTLELVADGTHLHPALYRHVSTTSTPERIVLVTDAMAAATLGDGTYRLGSLKVNVTGGVARIAHTTTIAGSTTTMDALFRRAAHDGDEQEHELRAERDLSDQVLLRAVQQTSTNPARSLGQKDLGSISTGNPANLVILSRDLRVQQVIRSGDPQVV